jgi:adenosylmethionine-8-amino-7-oxononanoate aminotransferase
MLCSGQIYAAIENGSGFFQHGHTYLGHPVAAAASLAVLRRLTVDRVLDHVAPMGDRLQAALVDRFGEYPHIGDIRGRGLFRGLELVADRATKVPFDPALALPKKIKAAAFDAGLLCYPMGGTIDGAAGAHILLAPPFIMDDDQISEVVDKLDIALKATLPA